MEQRDFNSTDNITSLIGNLNDQYSDYEGTQKGFDLVKETKQYLNTQGFDLKKIGNQFQAFNYFEGEQEIILPIDP